MTCSDEVVQTSDDATEMVSAMHSDSDMDIDFCSPFCQCSCCHVYIVSSSVVSYTIISPEISSEVNLQTKYIEDQFQYSFLDPPRA